MSDRNYTCVASAMQSSKKKHIQVGDTFTTNQGCLVKVVEYCSSAKVTVVFNDEYQHKITTTAQNISKGQIKNPYFKSVCGVGCIGVGDFVA